MGRSLTAIAGLLQSTGKTKEAEATYRKAETLLVELAPTIAEAAAVRAVLADCRSRLGSLLGDTGRNDEALSVYRLASGPGGARRRPRGDARVVAGPGGHDLQGGQGLADMGKIAEAEAEFRKALAIQQKLADDNPAVTAFRDSLAISHNNLANLLSNF